MMARTAFQFKKLLLSAETGVISLAPSALPSGISRLPRAVREQRVAQPALDGGELLLRRLALRAPLLLDLDALLDGRDELLVDLLDRRDVDDSALVLRRRI